MPACDARYDVLFNDGSGMATGHTGRNSAVIDMEEERLPDDWGDPGRLICAHLVRYWSRHARSMTYDRTAGGRFALWVDGTPRRTIASRRYLRWHEPDFDPPVDSEYDDPA
ncbi:hypothetical protein ACFOLC_00405 [Lysobacter cavernae]|uniref:Uncharacterized protein n=1 Tax=Lysobacter cavernae TaxID=1685901 RepID=A0ABV7RIK4_9GAMM